MVAEYFAIEVILTIFCIGYLLWHKYFQIQRLYRMVLLSIIGFAILLLELPFYHGGAWVFPPSNIIGITVLSVPIEEFLLYILILPLTSTTLWVMAGQLSRWWHSR